MITRKKPMDGPLPPLITLEEHYISPSILSNPKTSAWYVEQFKAIPAVRSALEDLGPIRLASMDANHISLQVISHGPTAGGLSVDECTSANDRLAAAVRRNPARFAGFAILPMNDPGAAAEELRRCRDELGFVGALVDNHVDGVFYDADAYDVFWRAAQELDMPVYLHPTWPAEHVMPSLTGPGIPEAATRSLGASGWGWHTETGLHVLRLFAAGMFDRFPSVKLVVGHFGEMIPYMLERINALSKRWGDRSRDFMEVYRENMWITVSGVWSLAPLATILRNTPLEHVLFSVDYPFATNEDGLKWVRELMQSGMVSREELDGICYGNAERLLRVKAPRR